MVEKTGLRQRIGLEFVDGMSVDEALITVSEAGDESLEMELSPEVAADFEAGLESEVGDDCGCGCGGSCSGSGHGLESSGCSGCHNHG
jgi:hypothetical protein